MIPSMLVIEIIFFVKTFLKVRVTLKMQPHMLPILTAQNQCLNDQPEIAPIVQRKQVWTTLTPLVIQLAILLPTIWLFWFASLAYPSFVLSLLAVGGVLMTVCLLKTYQLTNQTNKFFKPYQPTLPPRLVWLDISQQILGIALSYFWLGSLTWYTITSF